MLAKLNAFRIINSSDYVPEEEMRKSDRTFGLIKEEGLKHFLMVSVLRIRIWMDGAPFMMGFIEME